MGSDVYFEKFHFIQAVPEARGRSYKVRAEDVFISPSDRLHACAPRKSLSARLKPEHQHKPHGRAVPNGPSVRFSPDPGRLLTYFEKLYII